MTREEKVKVILDRLYAVDPNPKTALDYSNALELLVATILSAQCTDKLVNTVTPELFKRFKTAQDYADASVEEIDKYISKVTFHSAKAKNIKGAGMMMAERFAGEVPKNMADLDALPGVARKTANVVLGNVWGIAEGVVVDTHVMRLSEKYGLVDAKDPVKIEQELMKIVPKENWIDFSHLLINHGRSCCSARGSKPDCPLKDFYK